MPDDFDLYATGKGFVSENNPVRQSILKALARRPMTFGEIKEHSGKAQSTLSVHLENLERDGLIASEGVEGDRRKKQYVLVASLVGSSSYNIEPMRTAIRKHLAESPGEPFGFISAVLKAVIYGLRSTGIDFDPFLKNLGRIVGQEISGYFQETDLMSLVGEIAKFWKQHRLGTMVVESKAPITVVVDDCFDCGGIPDVGRTLCALDEGIIEGLLLEKTGDEYTTTEAECYGTGFNHCKFVVEIT